MSEDTEECGHIKNDDEPCTYSGSYPDGKCGFHTDCKDDDAPGPGRPTKLSHQVQEAIAADIEQGRSMRSAARKQDLTPQTIMNWMQRGEADKEEGKENEYTQFFDRITRAKGYGEEWYMQTIIELAEENEDHRFLMSLMKQRYPDSWGETETGVESTQVVIHDNEQTYTEARNQ